MNKKKIIIIISIFIVWVLALLLAYIIGSKNKVSETPKQENKTNNTNLKGISAYDTFDGNSLNIRIINVNEDNYYLQIEGLKDKQVEDKINKELLSIYTDLTKQVSKNKYSSIQMNVTSNINDILSITCEGYNGGNLVDYKSYNVSLINGEEIFFDDLFNDKTVINSIITNGLYSQMSLTNGMICAVDDCDSNIQNSTIEDTIYTLLRDIDYHDIEFNIYSSYIYFQIDEYYGYVYINDYGKYIDYPYKYKSSNYLYTKDFAVKNANYNIGNTSLIYFNRKYLNDNIFIDAAASGVSYVSEEDAYILNNIYKIDDVVKMYATNKDKKKLNYYNISVELETNDDYNLYGTYYFWQECTTTPDYFKNNVYKMIYDDAESDSNYLLLEEDKNVKCVDKEIKELDYVYNNDNKKIEYLSDLFKPGYDYLSVIKKYLETIGIDTSNIDERADFKIDVYSIYYLYNGDTVAVSYNIFDRNGFAM